MLVLNTILFMAAALPPVTARPDVSQRLGAVVCAAEPDNRPLGAWKQGVYDAQLDGRRVDLRAGRSPSKDELDRKAHALALTRGYLGFASGLCPDGTGWAATTPSPAPLTVENDGKITLPRTLDAACESYRVDFAASSGGPPTTLGAPHTVATAKLGDGVLSVTCQPPKPRFQGPVLWFLVPVGKGPAAELPAAAALADDRQPLPARLMSWVNAMRRAESLKALVFKKEMSEEAGVLGIDPTLTHNRAMLRKVGESLEANNVRLIGEDRVKARTAEAMAWLLWNSPRHRELLLDKAATVAGIATKDTRGETLAVLVIGEDQPVKTAKAGGKRRKSATD